MSRLRVYVAVFLGLTVVAGVAFWWNADWWAYYMPVGAEDWKPKFKMPIWFQVIVSAFVGSLASAVITLSIVAVDRTVHRVRRRRMSPSEVTRVPKM